MIYSSFFSDKAWQLKLPYSPAQFSRGGTDIRLEPQLFIKLKEQGRVPAHVIEDRLHPYRKFILDRFLPPYKDFDVVIGYRADDSYFSFARAFLANTISLEQLSRAMRLGKLGTQVVLRSPRAFEAIWKECSYPAPASIYHVRRVARDRKAREDFRRIQEETPLAEGCFLFDIIREDWNNEDPRLR